MAQAHAHDGCHLHYTDDGRGAPVVLIPGLGGDGAFWRPVAARLSPAFRVLTVDHRGAGESDRPEAGPYTIATLAADVLAVLAAAGVSRAHLVGHSTGGLIVQALALDHAATVDRLVMSGAWAKPDCRFRLMFEARLALLETGAFAAYQKLTQVLGYPPEWLEANRARIDAEVAAAPQRLSPVSVHAARIRMLLDHDRSGDLHRIASPALVLAATDDMMIPSGHARALAEAIPGARLTLLKGGHFFPAVDAEAYAGAVRQFLEES
jgi:pimeloyl-ACP methyl ester carboxylesterase